MNDFATVPDAPRSDNPAVLAALAADLAALDYTVDGVAGLLGAEAHQALGRDQTVPASLALHGRTEPLATVARLWLLAEAVTPEALAEALPRVGLDALATLGLVEAESEAAPEAVSEAVDQSASEAENAAARGPALLRAAVDLRPYGWPAETPGGADTDLWVASDLGAHQRPGVLRKDHVLGIGQASLTLAQGTIRRVVGRALDLGTGCGIQLFHLLHHANTVVATDISERALAFTRFNLVLNAAALGLSAADFDPNNQDARVSLRLGSLLEPVAGETFDLVVSNPPFVITPRHRGEDSGTQFTYRDGGLAGDAIVETLVRGLPTILAPGGIAQMLGNWEVVKGDAGTDLEWAARPSRWLAEDVQAWFIQREQVSPGAYAETWLQDASQGRDADAYASAYADYLHDFTSRNVAGIGFGYILLRKPDAARGAAQDAAQGTDPRAAASGSTPDPLNTSTRFEEILYPIEQPVGPHLAATLDREAWLDARDSILGEYFVVAGDVTEERHQKPGAEHPGVILLRQGSGLRRTNLLSTELAGFVSASDGELTVGQLIGALAALLERPDPEFVDGLEAEVRNLVRDGFLLPADTADSEEAAP
ncbi:SAM-dependent methyltransferase [Arthrobacter livingstonensis]|uniref:SAM-dependent methyltransferase n=1 Tax=Arthrobacter livingstonensis TaxID=670078 RepID=A0A2V5L486_9MICC|nr:methyltransferase [Arthrobacter livingstonensis]PYI66139.1 SAM-dependent methyltransferase [Arthrobacter livingstonensis]